MNLDYICVYSKILCLICMARPNFSKRLQSHSKMESIRLTIRHKFWMSTRGFRFLRGHLIEEI